MPSIPALTFIATSSSPGDVFSISYTRQGARLPPADQDHPPLDLDLGYLRRILLEILSKEEYETIMSYHRSRMWGERKPRTRHTTFSNDTDEEPINQSVAYGQVRLSDLRLVTAIGARLLKRELSESMQSLETPITTEGVLRWKWETFGSTNQKEKTERNRSVAVSFAAAALCLLLDLGMQGLREADRGELNARVVSLHNVIEKCVTNLRNSTEDLEKLIAPRGRGLPNKPVKEYTALHLYRMGSDLEKMADWLGITRYSEETGKGSKDWKNKVIEHLSKGVKVEEQRLPGAAEVFARHDEEAVRRRAIEAYGDYLQTHYQPTLGEWPPPMVDVGDNLAASILANTGDEIDRAYVQLGSCIEHGIDPLPSAQKQT